MYGFCEIYRFECSRDDLFAQPIAIYDIRLKIVLDMANLFDRRGDFRVR